MSQCPDADDAQGGGKAVGHGHGGVGECDEEPVDEGPDGGDDDNTIKLSGIDQFDMNICYDIVLPGKSMSDPLGSTWIVNVINLHNYCSSGISDIAHQQNVMCRFRAMEFGKPIAVCANFGYSCFIDCNGQIIKILTPNKKGTLSLHFPLKYRITTFCKYKNALLYIIIFILVSCMLCYKILYHRKNNEHL
jgi:apolipoprotein N-acyltransferase